MHLENCSYPGHVPRRATHRTMAIVLLAGWLGTVPLWAGGTPDPGTATSAGSTTEDQLLHIFGESRSIANGDFVATTSTGGLNTAHEFYIEVPPSQTRLEVELFDADIGAGGASEYFDADITGFNTPVSYRLYDPSGSQVTNVVHAAQGCTACDNAWTDLWDSASPAPVFESLSTAAQGSNANSIVVSTPSGTASGDLLLAAVSVDNNNGNAVISPPLGWTTLIEGTTGGGGGAIRGGIFYRIAGGSEPASYTFTWTGNSQQAVAGILRYSGVDNTTPIDVFGFTLGNSNTPTSPSITTTVANARIVRVMVADDDDTSAGVYPPKLDPLFDIDSNTGGGTTSAAAADSSQPSVGATGTAVFDLDGTGNEIWAALTIALAPAAGGAGSVMPGHWRLEVDSTDAGGEDGNNFGLRAHDGDATAGGTEYNVYAHSFLSLGEAAPGYTTNREYDLYPYVTAGCTVDINDFDGDNNGDYDLSTRAGVSQLSNQGVSANNQWSNVSVTGWTSSDEASDYGLWDLFFDGFPTGGSNNVYILYAGNELTTNPTTSSPFGNPSSQPESDTYRIYLPADGSSYSNGSGTINTPTKPYLAQFLTHVNGMGSNPPTAGNTTRYAITAQLANPTAFDVELDSSTAGTNVVTVVVPTSDPQIAIVSGSTVTTQGSASITTLGGGDSLVTWAPGTVAGGDTEAVFFQVDVTPSAPFNSAITVTGTPSSNGTVATWIDETCAGASCSGTQLSNATFTFGPICELEADPVAATPVMVSELSAHRTAAGAVVKWSTAAEAATTTLELRRRQGESWVVVGDGAYPALLGHPAGGRYHLLDRTAPAGMLEYLLVESDSLGRQTYHGPFSVDPDSASNLPVDVPENGGFEAVPHPAIAARRAGSSAERVGFLPDAPSTERRPLRFALGTRLESPQSAALVRITTGELAELSGETETSLRQLVADRQLALERFGQAVAYRTVAGGAALEWVAEGFEDPYGDTLVYWLERGAGRGFSPASSPPPPLAPAGATHFLERRRSEENLRAVTLLPLDPEGDIFFWDFLTAASPGHQEKSFSLELDDPAAGEIGRLILHLQGAQPGLHRLRVELGGHSLGEIELQDLEATSPSLSIPADVLVHGANDLRLVALEGGLVFVDAFTTEYARRHRAREDRLSFTGHGKEGLVIPGFSSRGVIVLDITDPRRPRVVAHREEAGTTPDEDAVVVHLGETDPARRYLAVGPNGVDTPATGRLDRPSNLLDPEHRADYLVVTTAELASAAGQLAARRAAEGLETLVVDLQDIWDELAFGHPDPRALRDFLAWAYEHWALPPHYVVLVGAGSYDYRDHLGLGGNLVPPLMAARDDSVFATDAPYADVRGDDGIPELALGRIPVTNAEQLLAYLDKLAELEAGDTASLADDLLLLTDTADAAGDFAADGDRLARLIPRGFELHRVDHAGDRDATRQQLFAELAAGRAMSLYLGHGGVDRLSRAGLLTSSDTETLGTLPTLPLLAAVSCHVALHALPGFDSLGEHLLLADNGGATAVWAPVWLSQHPQAIALGEELLRQLLHHEPPRLGEATRRALAGDVAAALPRHLRETYQLLGDPALRLPLDPAPPSDEPPCKVDCGS